MVFWLEQRYNHYHPILPHPPVSLARWWRNPLAPTTTHPWYRMVPAHLYYLQITLNFFPPAAKLWAEARFLLVQSRLQSPQFYCNPMLLESRFIRFLIPPPPLIPLYPWTQAAQSRFSHLLIPPDSTLLSTSFRHPPQMGLFVRSLFVFSLPKRLLKRWRRHPRLLLYHLECRCKDQIFVTMRPSVLHLESWCLLPWRYHQVALLLSPQTTDDSHLKDTSIHQTPLRNLPCSTLFLLINYNKS